MRGSLFIISAPSGAGKTTLVNRVFRELKSSSVFLEKVITYTTKKPRSGEKAGHDYYYVSRETFNEMLERGHFMEFSTAYTDCYGSPASVMDGLEKGVSYLIIVDRVGAQKILKKVPNAVLIWIKVPLEALRDRLTARGTDSQETIERRLKRAKVELQLENSEPLYTHYIENNDISLAVEELKTLICRVIEKKDEDFQFTKKG